MSQINSIKISTVVSNLKDAAIRAAEQKTVDLELMVGNERIVALAGRAGSRSVQGRWGLHAFFMLSALLGLAVGYVTATEHALRTGGGL